VEARLRDDASIGILINNAGAGQVGHFLAQTASSVEQLLALNTTALARLAVAIAPRLVQAGEGAIVNIGSVVGLAPEFGATIYGATKAFVLFLSQGMSLEPELMEVEGLVDAALVGFDRREAVTIPPLHEESRWDELDGARKGLLSDLRQAHAAELYQVAPQDH